METAELKYCRENLVAFFKWPMTEAFEFYEDETDCEEIAAEYARGHPRASGYVMFKSNWKGKRFFWVEEGLAEELDGMDCFLKVQAKKHERAKNLIQRRLFKR